MQTETQSPELLENNEDQKDNFADTAIKIGRLLYELNFDETLLVVNEINDEVFMNENSNYLNEDVPTETDPKKLKNTIRLILMLLMRLKPVERRLIIDSLHEAVEVAAGN